MKKKMFYHYLNVSDSVNARLLSCCEINLKKNYFVVI